MMKTTKEKEKNQNIQVFVRARPLSAQERKQSSFTSVEVYPDKKEIVVRERPHDKVFNKTYTFDKVFAPDSKQVDVYKAVVGPLLEEVLMGYNCTVFAYGQTGTGKTFTMEGERSSSLNDSCSWEEDPLAGIIPRSLHQLFEELEMQGVEYTVRVSFLELYNEELFDLLSPCNDLTRLRLYESSTKKGSIIIHNLNEVSVNSKDDVYQILEKGSMKRQTAATLMNAHSSRSHSVFSVTVTIKENTSDGEELLKIGKLNLVDLAGSENIGKSGAVDKRAREAGSINQSLLTLGRVINALVEKAPHVPYRESKLTRLLQDSLGGRTKTSIIATISPSSCNSEETISTLDYAHRAKNITNRPEVNQKMTKRALVKELNEEIDRLRRELIATQQKNGYYLPEEDYHQMERRLREQTNDIQSRASEIEMLQAEIEKMNSVMAELKQTKLALHKTEQILHTKTEELVTTEKKLVETAKAKEEQEFLVSEHCKKEKVLSEQAKKLLEVADDSTNDVQELHSKLERKKNVETVNSQQSQSFRVNFHENLSKLEGNVGKFADDELAFYRQLLNKHGEKSAVRSDELTILRALLSSQTESQQNYVNSFNQAVLDRAVEDNEWVQKSIEQTKHFMDSSVNNKTAFRNEKLHPLTEKILTHLREYSENSKNSHSLCLSHVEQLKGELDYAMRLADQNDAFKLAMESLFIRMNDLRLMNIKLVNEHEAVNARMTDSFNDDLKKLEEQINLMKVKHSKFETEKKANLDSLRSNLAEEVGVNDELKTQVNSYSASLLENSAELQKKQSEGFKVLEHEMQSGLSKQLESKNQVELEATTLTSDVVAFTESLSNDVQNYHRESERCHRMFAQKLSENVRMQQLEAQSLSSSVTSIAEKFEHELETQQNRFADSLREEGEQLNTRCSIVSEWSNHIDSEFHQRSLELDRYFDEELKKDVATGKTPQRREFHYPRDLVETSPHERLLSRFRNQRRYNRNVMDVAMNIALPESSEDESDVGSEKGSTTNLLSDVSIVSEFGEKSDTEYKENVSISSTSNSSLNIPNNNDNPSRSKLKQPQKFRKPPVSKSRKPLSTANPLK